MLGEKAVRMYGWTDLRFILADGLSFAKCCFPWINPEQELPHFYAYARMQSVLKDQLADMRSINTKDTVLIKKKATLMGSRRL